MAVDQGHPTTIDSSYTGPEPPVGTILAWFNTANGWHQAIIHSDADPEFEWNSWEWTGSDCSDRLWVEVPERIGSTPFTVIRWGAG